MSAQNDMLDEVLGHLRVQELPPFPRDRMITATVRALHGEPVRATLDTRRTAARFQYFLIAALVLIVAGIGLISRIGPFSVAESFAFEQVLSSVGRVKSVSYTVTTTGWKGDPWPDPLVGKTVAMQSGMSRFEKNDELQIFNSQAGRFMRIQRKTRTATIRPLYPSADGKPASFHLDELTERLRNIPATAKPRSNLGTIQGRAALPFSWRVESDEYLVYVDPATRLPVLMEVNHGLRGDKEIKEVYDNFAFDKPVDPSIFELAVPPGYAVEEYAPDKSNKTYPQGDAVDLVVSPTSIGPVKRGMRADEIVKLLGKPDWMSKPGPAAPIVTSHPDISQVQGMFQQLNYDSRGFSLTIAPGGMLSISCVNQDRCGPVVRDFMGRTAEGIRLGDTREKVLKTYGKPELDQHGALNYVALGWQFFFHDDKLCGISTNMPMPRRAPKGAQTRVLKDGTVLQAAPGVDIDAMIDKDGSLKRGPLKTHAPPKE